VSEGELLLRIDPERIGASGIRTVLARCEDSSHRSLSSDGAWDGCQWKSNAVDLGLITRRFGEKAAVGSAVHAAVAAELLGDPVDIRGMVDSHLEADGVDPFDLAKTYEKAERLYGLWYEDVRPEWLSVGVYAVEWELHFQIGDVIYHVHPDCVLADGSLRDLKTSEKRLEQFRANYDHQLTTYAYSLWRVFDHVPPRVGLDGLIYANPPADIAELHPGWKKPWHDRQDSSRTVAQFRTFEESVARREASRRFAATSGIYQTQAEHGQSWVCRSCEARTICPAWREYEWPGQIGAVSESD